MEREEKRENDRKWNMRRRAIGLCCVLFFFFYVWTLTKKKQKNKNPRKKLFFLGGLCVCERVMGWEYAWEKGKDFTKKKNINVWEEATTLSPWHSKTYNRYHPPNFMPCSRVTVIYYIRHDGPLFGVIILFILFLPVNRVRDRRVIICYAVGGEREVRRRHMQKFVLDIYIDGYRNGGWSRGMEDEMIRRRDYPKDRRVDRGLDNRRDQLVYPMMILIRW